MSNTNYLSSLELTTWGGHEYLFRCSLICQEGHGGQMRSFDITLDFDAKATCASQEHTDS